MPVTSGIDYSYVPVEGATAGLRNYFEKHLKPGDFLTGLLENDFLKVYRHADPVNRGRLADWAQWLQNEAPMHTYGSKQKVSDWIQKKPDPRS